MRYISWREEITGGLIGGTICTIDRCKLPIPEPLPEPYTQAHINLCPIPISYGDGNQYRIAVTCPDYDSYAHTHLNHNGEPITHHYGDCC